MTGGEAVKDNVGSTRKISELDDLALSRLIAELFAHDLYQGRCDTTSTKRYDFPCTCGSYPMNLGPCIEWTEDDGGGNCPYCAHAKKCHQPVRNAVTDPAMRDLLQEKLLEDGWRVYVRKESSGVFWIALTHITAGQNESFDIECATRERLWPEAYALAHGLGER